MLAQLLYNSGRLAESVHHASLALARLYEWATQWDKRVSWAQWVGFRSAGCAPLQLRVFLLITVCVAAEWRCCARPGDLMVFTAFRLAR